MMEAFNGDHFILDEVKALIVKYKIATVIETGTNHGKTTQALAALAPAVLTIEIDENLWLEAEHLEAFANIKRYCGDSALVLPVLLEEVPRPILFYLDAHWGEHSPLLDELDAIAKHQLGDSVIVIHDFYNPQHPDYGYDSWDIGPYKYELIEPYLNQIYPGGFTCHYNDQAEGERRGVIYVEVAASSSSRPA